FAVSPESPEIVPYQGRGCDRYNCVSPFVHNAVKLSSGKYINASHMVALSGRKFIATQAPLPTTFQQFWEMIDEYKVKVIVIVGNLKDGQVTKMHDYWTGQLKEEKEYPNYIERKFERPHGTVHQYHYTRWPDHGVPKSPDGL